MRKPARHGMGEGRAVGAVLAGGLGTRLGGSKALAELGGRPLIAYPLAAAADAGLEPLVVAKPDTELPALECRVVREPAHPVHPLAGVVAALDAVAGRAIVVCACDMPFVPARLLDWLAGLDEPAVVTEAGGRLQPLLARYESRLGPRLEGAVARGEAARDSIAALSPRVVDESELGRFGDPERIAFNVNTPEDLRRAEALLADRPTG